MAQGPVAPPSHEQLFFSTMGPFLQQPVLPLHHRSNAKPHSPANHPCPHLGYVAHEQALRHGAAHVAARQLRDQLGHSQAVVGAQRVHQRHRLELDLH